MAHQEAITIKERKGKERGSVAKLQRIKFNAWWHGWFTHSGESFTFILYTPVIRIVSPEALLKTRSLMFSMFFTTASSGVDARYSCGIKLAQAPVSIKANLLMLWKTTDTRNRLYVLCLQFISESCRIFGPTFFSDVSETASMTLYLWQVSIPAIGTGSDKKKFPLNLQRCSKLLECFKLKQSELY